MHENDLITMLKEQLAESDRKIARLTGMYHCAIGRPAVVSGEDYMNGYAEQYELQEKKGWQYAEI